MALELAKPNSLDAELRRCYTMQLALQLVSQRLNMYFKKCMNREVTLYNVSCNLSREII